jgi:hypothetical protein
MSEEYKVATTFDFDRRAIKDGPIPEYFTLALSAQDALALLATLREREVELEEKLPEPYRFYYQKWWTQKP